MAEILDQKAIDELLNGSLDIGDETEEFVDDTVETSKPKSGKKIIKPILTRRLRFDYSYESPVVKKEKIIIDPADDTNVDSNQPIVYTIGAYNARHRNKL